MSMFVSEVPIAMVLGIDACREKANAMSRCSRVLFIFVVMRPARAADLAAIARPT